MHAIAGAFLELLMWWIDGRTQLSADDVAAAFARFSQAALASATSGNKR